VGKEWRGDCLAGWWTGCAATDLPAGEKALVGKRSLYVGRMLVEDGWQVHDRQTEVLVEHAGCSEPGDQRFAREEFAETRWQFWETLKNIQVCCVCLRIPELVLCSTGNAAVNSAGPQNGRLASDCLDCRDPGTTFLATGLS